MEEQDVNNYSSSPHRLPTISASQSLQDIVYVLQKPISTGLLSLDRILSAKTICPTASGDNVGGLPCGRVTEIYGPPGAGKTILSLNVASNALLAGASVAWIDAAYVLHGRRLKDHLAHLQQKNEQTPEEALPVASTVHCLEKFHQFMAPTLSHLLALLVHPTPSFPPNGTSLLVIDSISTPFSIAFAQGSGHDDRSSGKKTDVARWAAGRRWAVMGDLASAMSKLAATRNMAVMVTSQTTTKLKLESAALLQPAMTGAAWDAGIDYRVLLFRDWQAGIDDESSQERGERSSDMRFAAVTKIGGGSFDVSGETVPFAIEQYGLRQTTVTSPAISMPEPTASIQSVLKRKRDEIADSASESGDLVSGDEFGWEEG